MSARGKECPAGLPKVPKSEVFSDLEVFPGGAGCERRAGVREQSCDDDPERVMRGGSVKIRL